MRSILGALFPAVASQAKAACLVTVSKSGGDDTAKAVKLEDGMAHSLVSIIVWASVFALALPPFLVALPYSKAFPYSDEWMYVSPGSGSFQWFFTQYVDHRIPVQKAIQLLTLDLAHFDFRALVAVNFFLAAAASALFIVAARLYRGRSSVGDALIPLCLLSLGTGFSEWGFEFDFLSSSVYCAAFLALMLKYDQHRRPAYIIASIAVLFLSACGGLNGVILSTTISLALSGFIVVNRLRPGMWTYATLAVTIVTNLAIWALWVPSPAARGQFDLMRAANFSLSMVNGPLMIYSFVHTTWKLAALLALIVAGAILVTGRLLRTGRPADFSVTAVLVANVILLAATGYGRSKQIDWQPVLVMHYGTLAIPLVITAWIAISSIVGRKVEIPVGVALVVLFTLAYKANYDWRVGSDAEERSGRLAAGLAIAGTDDPEQVAARYIKQYMYLDTEPLRQWVGSCIPVLRKHWHYSTTWSQALTILQGIGESSARSTSNDSRTLSR